MKDRIDVIGQAAGEIWRHLEGKADGMTLKSLKAQTQLPSDLFHQGLGWLAREDKIRFISRSGTIRVLLS